MDERVVTYFVRCICFVLSFNFNEAHLMEYNITDIDYVDSNNIELTQQKTSQCWMSLNSPKLFNVMDEIDARYEQSRNEIQAALTAIDFDRLMINGFTRSRGVALRELAPHHYYTTMIPSGINLGGWCMLKMTDSVLFFHRMKLRNNTYFRVNGLHNDLANMVVRINLSLFDLHLKGTYERSLTDRNPSVLIYAPTLGQVEFLLKDVLFKAEGRYRLIKNRLMIELISSEIFSNDILMTYINQAIESDAVRVDSANLGAFLDRLKADLNRWIKDYFNDYLIYAQLDQLPNIDQLSQYDKEKETALEEYTDEAINGIKDRIRTLNADTIRLPDFVFKSIHGLKMKLYDGSLQGLDSMYRRSVATGYKQRAMRKIDTLVGFSNLKVVYKYEAVIPTGLPPLAGTLTLSANELTAHLALAMVKNPEAYDLDIEFLNQMKPESLTVEGAANILISNYRHLLEHQIISIMSNTLIHGIRMLKSLPSCEPFIPGQVITKKYNENSVSADEVEFSESESWSEYEQIENRKTDKEGEYKTNLRSTEKPTKKTHKKNFIKRKKHKNQTKVKKNHNAHKKMNEM